MKGNYSSLKELALEVERIEQSKEDYVTTGKGIMMMKDDTLSIGDKGSFVMTEYAHSQLAEKLGIPKRYYDDISKIPNLRTINVNELIRHNEKTGYMVRTLDNKARAVLSNSFRPIDNYDVLMASLPAIKDLDVSIKSCSLTDKKMYLQVVSPRLQFEVKKGDVVQWGFVMSNSEIGYGAVDIKSLVWRCFCDNGAIGESILRKYHIGSRLDANQADIYKSDTIRMELESFKLRLRDILVDVLSQKRFMEQCQKMQLATEDQIPRVTETVQTVTKRFGLSEKFNDMIIENMVKEGNLNRWGLANGITYLAHSIESPDAQYEVEKIGSKIINMSRNEFNQYVAV